MPNLPGYVLRVLEWLYTEDIKVDTYALGPPPRSGSWAVSSKGGVRVTHVPTSLSASSETERSQHRDKEKAMEKLALLMSGHPKGAAPSPEALTLSQVRDLKAAAEKEIAAYMLDKLQSLAYSTGVPVSSMTLRWENIPREGGPTELDNLTVTLHLGDV
jgi:hypothetical protein